MGRRHHRVSLEGPVAQVAPLLLGSIMRTADVAIRLTEVEAYAGESDPGSHAFRGRTARTDVMFGRAGFAYVYFTYGMHWCMNVVTGPDGVASAVLLRAGEVVEGVGSAQTRRARSSVRDLARGPARLTSALGVNGTHGGIDLLDPGSPVRLELGPPPAASDVRSGPRVGVGGAGAVTPWRFWLDGEPTVSVYRPAGQRRGRAAS